MKKPLVLNCDQTPSKYVTVGGTTMKKKSHSNLVWVGLSTSGVFTFPVALFWKVILPEKVRKQYNNIDKLVICLKEIVRLYVD